MKNESQLFTALPDVLNVHELQEALGIGRAGVYKLLESRSIRCFTIGNAYKIPKRALVEFIEAQCHDREGGAQV